MRLLGAPLVLSAWFAGCAAHSTAESTIGRYEQWLAAQRPPTLGVGTPRSRGDVVFVTDRRGDQESGLSVVRLRGQTYYVFDGQVDRLLLPAFSDGLAAVVVPVRRWGYINQTGRFVFKPQFRAANPFDHGVATAFLPSGWVLLHPDGIVKALDPSIVAVREFSQNLAAFRNASGRIGYLDRDGRIVIAPLFDAARPFCANGLAPVHTQAGWGFVNVRGSLVVTPRFDEVRCFAEGLAAAKRGKWGFADATGRFVVAPAFDAAGDFSDGLAAVATPKYGFIDRAGKTVIAPRYDAAYPFAFGIAKVGMQRVNWLIYPISYFVPADPRYIAWSYIDRSGNAVR